MSEQRNRAARGTLLSRSLIVQLTSPVLNLYLRGPTIDAVNRYPVTGGSGDAGAADTALSRALWLRPGGVAGVGTATMERNEQSAAFLLRFGLHRVQRVIN